MSFEKFEMHADILSAVQAIGFKTPTPIQQQAIPLVRDGRDVIASAQTGTGKTAAFLLPVLHQLLQAQPKEKGFQVLILEPTRELAIQVQEHAERFCAKSDIRCHCVYGGVGMEPQKEAFKRGVELIVATPGRLLDHFRQGNADASKLKVLILDEADRMLDMGFIPDVRSILRKLPTQRQTLFFSATISGEVKRLSEEMLKNPTKIEIEPDLKTASKVIQEAYLCPEHLKPFLLARLLEQDKVTSALIFTQTKVGADKVCAIVERKNMKVSKIHGDLGQGARQKALSDFKEGNVNVLVATDIAARGIDVDGISHVINFNPPEGSDDYIHRIGRTARADKEGHAYTLFAPAESMALGKIEKAIKQKIPRKTIEDFDYSEELGPQHEIRQGHNVAEFKSPRGRSSSSDRGGSKHGDSRRGRPSRGNSRPARGGRNEHKRDDSSDTQLAEITIKRAGDKTPPITKSSPPAASKPLAPQILNSDKGKNLGRGTRDSKRDYEIEREKRHASADLTANDILRKASEQKAVVDDTGLRLRPEISIQKKTPDSVPEEKFQGTPKESQKKPSRRGGRNRNRTRNGQNKSSSDKPVATVQPQPGQASTNGEQSLTNRAPRDRPRRRRRRGGRGRNPNRPATATQVSPPKKGGLLSKIKSLFSGK